MNTRVSRQISAIPHFFLEEIQACRMDISEVTALAPTPGLYFLNFSRQQIILSVARPHARNRSITHVAAVHCETTTGMLNPAGEISQVIKKYGRIFILNAMSSFGGVPMDLADIGVDFMISSANKCIQGVPGFGFVIAEKKVLGQTQDQARSLSLALYDQWRTIEKGQEEWRFTSPTHVVRAFEKALDELAEEGGILARWERYASKQCACH